MNKKYQRVFMPGSGYYLWAILALVLTVAIMDVIVAVPGMFLFLFLLIHSFRLNYRRQKEITRYIENLTLNIESASKDTLLNFPLPLVVVELNGTIVWYNSLSRSVFGDSKLFDRNIDTLIEGFRPQELANENESISRNVNINYRNYRIIGNFVKTREMSDMGSYILLLYFIDITEQIRLKNKYEDEKAVVGIITIDNYEDLLQSLVDPGPHQLLAEIDKKISEYMSFSEGIIRKFERDKYLILFEARHLTELKKRKFDILDAVKEINLGNKIPVTLSMGFGVNAETIIERYSHAEASIDMALARGGDQVVIKDGETLSFFGGKTRELEKRTRVKARVVAYALRELIDRASTVFIMGHENGDIDSFGSSLGIYSIARCRNRNAHIVLEKSNPGIDRLYKKLKEEDGYEGVVISSGEARDLIDDKTLLIVVDTHRPSFTEAPEIIDMVSKKVVIDHHRRGAQFIEDAVLVYQEAYASSTAELVTEILQYVDEKIKLTPVEVQGLYAGIVLDTKNFTFKTGVRTFEAASYLRRKGVDTSSVRYLFQNDLETYSSVSSTVKNAELLLDRVAVSIVPKDVRFKQLIAAKAADELLSLAGVDAAFVLSSNDTQVSISGRSLGDLNVQTILEKLGGGGHMTVAGAQLENITPDDAKAKLKYAIMESIRENTPNEG